MPPRKATLFIQREQSKVDGTCASSGYGHFDCLLSFCRTPSDSSQTDAGTASGAAATATVTATQDEGWNGWKDYPARCCNVTCPPGSQKDYKWACSCICPVRKQCCVSQLVACKTNHHVFGLTFLSTLVVPVFYVVMKSLLGEAEGKQPAESTAQPG